MEEVEKKILESVKEQEGEMHGLSPLSFTKVTDYTTFFAEYSSEGEDLIVHFFPPPEYLKQQDEVVSWKDTPSRHAWEVVFPDLLSPAAQDFFSADYPQLKASYTPELRSWWLRANGVLGLTTAEQLSGLFFEKLDQLLDASSNK